MDRPERATIQMFLFCSRSSTFVVLKNEIYFVDLDRMPSKRKRSACCFERGSAPRLCQLAKNVLYKILRSSIFTSSRGRRSMASTHSDTHATAPQPPNPQTSHLSALLEDVAVAGVVVAGGARLAVHVGDVGRSRIELEK